MFEIKFAEKINTHSMFSDLFFFSENRAVCEIMSKHMVEPERTQTIWRLRVAYWVRKPTHAQAHARARAPTLTKPTTPAHSHTDASTHMLALTNARAHTHTHTHAHTHTEIRNTYCFPRQQWFRERASM